MANDSTNSSHSGDSHKEQPIKANTASVAQPKDLTRLVYIAMGVVALFVVAGIIVGATGSGRAFAGFIMIVLVVGVMVFGSIATFVLIYLAIRRRISPFIPLVCVVLIILAFVAASILAPLAQTKSG